MSQKVHTRAGSPAISQLGSLMATQACLMAVMYAAARLWLGLLLATPLGALATAPMGTAATLLGGTSRGPQSHSVAAKSVLH
jgi:hypothetical protein